jgi:voltage-gated potassium channel Kch
MAGLIRVAWRGGAVMSDTKPSRIERENEYGGTFRNGYVQLDGPVEWAEGTRVIVRAAPVWPAEGDAGAELGPVIVAGFGLAGRWVADIFDRHKVSYVIVDQNHETYDTQTKLGRRVICGDISNEQTMREAGIEAASILCLTIPDDQAVLRATELARRLKPDIYIVARTTYSSIGMQASRLGADAVIKAEQAVARQFYEMLVNKLKDANGPSEE